MSDEFHAFEKAGWSERGVVEHYERAIGRLTTQAIPPLLEAVGAAPGTRLLDVACGPGYVAAQAAARGAAVSAIDFSPAMVARARAEHAAAGGSIEFHEGDAHALPFADGSFDAVVTNFGMLHFANPERAMKEAHRVLAPGGRFAFTVWSPPERAVGLSVAQTAAQAHGDPGAAGSLPAGPAFFRFSDPGECVRALEAAGLIECRVTEVPQVWRLASVEELLTALGEGTVRNRALLRAQSEEARARIEGAIRRGLMSYQKADGSLEIPMPAVLASARRAPASDMLE